MDMTCDEIREQILLVPLREYGARARMVIEGHTENCERCGAAWRAELLLAERLNELPEIRPQSDTVSSVLARLAVFDDRRAAVAAGQPRAAETDASWGPWAASAGPVSSCGIR